jgi:hypothetical protein
VKLVVALLLKFPALYSYAEEPTICPYPDPDESSHILALCFLKIYFNIIL